MTTLLAVFALIVSLNATIHTQHAGLNCSSIVSSVNAYAAIVEPVHGIPVGYTPLLVVKLRKPMNIGSLRATALVAETRQDIPLSIKRLTNQVFSLHAKAVVPLGFSISYKVMITVNNKTCVLIINVSPPRIPKRSISNNTNPIVVRRTQQTPALIDYDPLGLISTNISVTPRQNVEQKPLIPISHASRSSKTVVIRERDVLLAIALGFLVAALIGLIVDRFFSRQSIQ